MFYNFVKGTAAATSPKRKKLRPKRIQPKVIKDETESAEEEPV